MATAMANSVLVTGAGNGLGLETAVYLAERGFRVYASMRDPSKREHLDRLASERKVDLRVLRLDITDGESIAEAVRTIVDESGTIYGLVNNAGIGLRGYFEDLTDAEIRNLFEVNIFGTMAVTRAVLPHMRAARRGRIVIITSIGGRLGSIGVSAYCSTKFAQEGFGESLAQEVVPFGIYVSLVEPAIIKTERWDLHRSIAAGAMNPQSPYYAWFCEAERRADRLVETSPTQPVDVARAIHSALSSPRPRLRYMVGRRANLAVVLRRYLPERLFERLFFGEAIRRITGPAKRQIQDAPGTSIR